jgi:rhamnogalacturonyl hydrolase YesR
VLAAEIAGQSFFQESDAAALDDDRYLRFVDAEFAFAYDALFDSGDGLFYRYARFIEQRTPSGAKVFWSRGNGWVYAGLALFLDSLPQEYPTRSFYVALLNK